MDLNERFPLHGSLGSEDADDWGPANVMDSWPASLGGSLDLNQCYPQDPGIGEAMDPGPFGDVVLTEHFPELLPAGSVDSADSFPVSGDVGMPDLFAGLQDVRQAEEGEPPAKRIAVGSATDALPVARPAKAATMQVPAGGPSALPELTKVAQAALSLRLRAPAGTHPAVGMLNNLAWRPALTARPAMGVQNQLAKLPAAAARPAMVGQSQLALIPAAKTQPATGVLALTPAGEPPPSLPLPIATKTEVLRVRYHGPPGSPPSDNLYVKGLPVMTTNDSSVRALVSEIGTVRRLRLMPPAPPQEAFCALVQMSSAEEATQVIQALNGKTVEHPAPIVSCINDGHGPPSKTRLCKFFSKFGNCTREEKCGYAHGTENLLMDPNATINLVEPVAVQPVSVPNVSMSNLMDPNTLRYQQMLLYQGHPALAAAVAAERLGLPAPEPAAAATALLLGAPAAALGPAALGPAAGLDMMMGPAAGLDMTTS